MSAIYLLLFLLIGGFILFYKRKEDPKNQFVESRYLTDSGLGAISLDAINFDDLTKSGFANKQKQKYSMALNMVGNNRIIKIILFLAVVIGLTGYINYRWLGFPVMVFVPICSLAISLYAVRWLLEKRRNNFNRSFPDALNIMMSSVTAGESINHAFAYVGEVLDNDVGKEFKDIADRMRIGESTEQIFKRSCRVFPYSAFLFFVVAIRANFIRGGELKPVLSRLIRVLIDARALEKKKYAMTSEARISAKIVGAIPFIFMVTMHFNDPEGLNYVLFNPNGQWIFYYVLISEGMGMFIIWWLVRGIK